MACATGRAVQVQGVGATGRRQECQLIDRVSQPEGQRVLGLHAETQGGLLLRHLALGADTVAQLINLDRLRVGQQRFFVAFQLVVTDNATAREVRDQGHDAFRAAFGLGQIGNPLHGLVDVRRGRTHEAIGHEKGFITPLFCYLCRPNPLLQAGEGTKVGRRHFSFPSRFG